jgi:hypothetical protein
MGCIVTIKIGLVIFYLFTLLQCVDRDFDALGHNVQRQRYDLFNAYNFIIKYGGEFKHWRFEALYFRYAPMCLIKICASLG